MTDHRDSAAGYDTKLGNQRGDTAAVDVASPRVSINEQIEEVAREIRQRERLYPEWVAKGRYNANTAERKLRDLNAAHATLLTIAAHADGLRALIEVLRRVAKYGPTGDAAPISDGEAELLLQHPAVAAVLREFPDAIISDIRPLESIT